MKTRLKGFKAVMSAVVSSVILINSTAAYAEGEADNSIYFSVPTEFSFEATEEAEGEDIVLYEWLEEAVREKNERYEQFKLSRASYPSSVNLNVAWEQQTNNYYCGPATAAVILKHIGYTYATQEILAGDNYLSTDKFKSTPWFSGMQSQSSQLKYYNMPYGLNQYQNVNHSAYVDRWPYEVCNSGNEEEYIDKIMFTLSEGYPVPLNGCTPLKNSISSDLNKYPEGHWVVLQGYNRNGDNFLVVDPAYGLKGFATTPTYTASKSDILEFIQLGVVW